MTSKRHRTVPESENATEPFPDFDESQRVYEPFYQRDAAPAHPKGQDFQHETPTSNIMDIPPHHPSDMPTAATGEILSGEWKERRQYRILTNKIFITASLADDGAFYFHFRHWNLTLSLEPAQSNRQRENKFVAIAICLCLCSYQMDGGRRVAISQSKPGKSVRLCVCGAIPMWNSLGRTMRYCIPMWESDTRKLLRCDERCCDQTCGL